MRKFVTYEGRQYNATPNLNYPGQNSTIARLQPKAKHSGAKLTRYTPTSGDNAGKEMHLVTAWKLSRNKELISIKATTTHKTKLSEKGWFGSVAVTFTNTVTGETNFHWATMQKSTGKTVIQSCGMVLNPKAKNGGYAGTFINSEK